MCRRKQVDGSGFLTNLSSKITEVTVERYRLGALGKGDAGAVCCAGAPIIDDQPC